MKSEEVHPWFDGAPIRIATKTYQRRKHRKKRINKKWAKRYGYASIDYLPHGKAIQMPDGAIYMTQYTFDKLMSGCILYIMKEV